MIARGLGRSGLYLLSCFAQFENAVSELRTRYHSFQPTDPACYQILSESCHFLGRDKEAIAEMEQTLFLFGQRDAYHRAASF